MFWFISLLMKRTFKRALNIPEAVFDICCFSKKHVKQQKPRKAQVTKTKRQWNRKACVFLLFFRVTKRKWWGIPNTRTAAIKPAVGKNCQPGSSASLFFLAKPNQTKPSQAGKKQFWDWSCGRFTNVRAVKSKCMSHSQAEQLTQDTCGPSRVAKGSEALKIIALIIARRRSRPKALLCSPLIEIIALGPQGRNNGTRGRGGMGWDGSTMLNDTCSPMTANRWPLNMQTTAADTAS